MQIQTKGSVGYDLLSAKDVIITPGQTQVIETLVEWTPEKYVGKFGMVCSRSGLAANKQVFVLNAPGIIDQDYNGPIQVILHNASTEPYEVRFGDRIAQMLLFNTDVLHLEYDEEATERTGGLGSTGR